MFCCTDTEVALKKRFENAYLRANVPVMQEIERRVCGCDYGGNSWTTRAQAESLLRQLGLREGAKLLDLGAGTGWPGIFLAKESGCEVCLVDLPEIGLKVAEKRALDEGIAEQVSVQISDAADLPFEAASFDAISHSDLLCCLVRKQDVLHQCRNVIRPEGKMAFTVISIAPNLSKPRYARAVANAPEFVETESNYQSLLQQTGWRVDQMSDLTSDYAESCARQIETDIDNQSELAELLGPSDTKDRLANWYAKLDAINDGLYLRELFVCEPN